MPTLPAPSRRRARRPAVLALAVVGLASLTLAASGAQERSVALSPGASVAAPAPVGPRLPSADPSPFLLAAGPAAAPPVSSRSRRATAAPSPRATATPVRRELPRGGRSIFPEHVVVAYYGTAGTGALGVLGETDPDTAARRTLQAGIPFQPAFGRKLLPAFELITTVAQARAGADGQYTSYLPVEEVRRYLAAARRAKMLLILDFQPGRAEFLEQVKRYESVLVEPEVGIALDPEWKLTPTQLPLRQIGRTSARPLNDVSSYLANLVKKHDLPEKIFMIHQFKVNQIPDRTAVVRRPGLELVLHVDGFGSRGQKRDTYAALASRDGSFVNAFKLFYDEDRDAAGRSDLMSPTDVAALVPRPELFTYQ